MSKVILHITKTICLGTMALFLWSGSTSERPPALDTPNIIFLLADDLRYDLLGYAGNPIIRTPAIDSLAARGAVFTNAYVTTAICGASRASILTGQYARRHGINSFGALSDQAFDQTYPALLKNAGYRTGFIGKYGLGNINYAGAQFDYWRGFPGQGSFNAQDDQGNPIHLTRLMGLQAAEFINSNPDGQPFALSVSFKAPHVEGGTDNWAIYDPAFADEYEGAWFPQPLSGEVDYFQHFPPAFLENNEARIRYFYRFGDPETGQESLEGYYRLVHGIDRAVSRIVSTLEAQGLLDNTVIILTSDNGMYLGEYGFSGKWYGSDASIRVPMLICDPAAPAGNLRDETVLNIDVAPTILDYAGLPAPAGMQGNSLRPLVENAPAVSWRTDFLYEHRWDNPCCDIPSTEGVVNDTAKYMRYFQGLAPASLLFEELYDRDQDPAEVRNLAGQPAYEPLQSSLENRLLQLIDEME